MVLYQDKNGVMSVRSKKIYKALSNALFKAGRKIKMIGRNGHLYCDLTEDEHIKLDILVKRIKAINDKLYSVGQHLRSKQAKLA